MNRTPGYSEARQSRHRSVLAISCAVVVLAFLLAVRQDQRVEFRFLKGWPLPHTCWLYCVWGVKCPGCGLTRSLIYLAQGDWRSSWEVHRLGCVMAVAALSQIPYCLAGILCRKDYPLGKRTASAFAWTLIVLLVANWLFDVIVAH